MANKKITALTENTAPATSDLLAQVDMSGTPETKKVTLQNLLEVIPTLNVNTTPASTDQLVMIDDPGGSPEKQYITIANVLKAILTTNGDIMYRDNSGNITRLGIGSPTEVLAVTGAGTGLEWSTSNTSGWVADSNTWTYASATTFTVSGDVTAQFVKGTKLKLIQTGTKYFYVVSSSYGAPNTTVTITGGSDYTLVSAAITSTNYSYQTSPQGFPGWFNYTPTWSAASTPPSVGNGTLVGTFSMVGPIVTCKMRLICGSTTTYGSGNYGLSLPVTAVALIHDFGLSWLYDNTATLWRTGTCYALADNNVIHPYFDATNSGWSPTVPVTLADGDYVGAQISYRI